MAVSRIAVELFYDVISPYSYIAFETLLRYQTPWNLDVKLKPFFLADVIRETSNRPPGFVLNKTAYMADDLRRLSGYFGIPIEPPDVFLEYVYTAKTTLTPQRFLVALDLKHPKYLEQASRGFWKRFYEEHKDINSEDDVADVARKIGMTGGELENALAMIEEDAVKKVLDDNTKRAVEEYGAFGAPTIVAHVGGKPEMFFGCDRFGVMASVLGKEWRGPKPT